MMKELAKLGFTQSYTYFTWRNDAWELSEYLTELTQTADARVLSRAISSPIHPTSCRASCRLGGAPAFRMRLVLAATLSSVYGIYSGFELCENRRAARVDSSTTWTQRCTSTRSGTGIDRATSSPT